MLYHFDNKFKSRHKRLTKFMVKNTRNGEEQKKL